MKKLLFGVVLALACSFACASGSGSASHPITDDPITHYLSPITSEPFTLPVTHHPSPITSGRFTHGLLTHDPITHHSSPITRYPSPEEWRSAKSDSEAMRLAELELDQRPRLPISSISGPTTGAVAYGDGTQGDWSSAPTTGYLLQGNSTGAPTWAALDSLISAGAGISITGTTALTIAAQSATSSTLGSLELNTDLGGAATAPEVVGLNGVPLASGSPTNNQYYAYNSSSGKFALATSPASLPSLTGSNKLLYDSGTGTVGLENASSTLTGGTGVTISGTTPATVSIGQSVATTATPTFGTLSLQPSTFTNGVTVKYPSDAGGGNGLLVEDSSGLTGFGVFWGTNGKLTIDGSPLTGATVNQATIQLGTAPGSYATASTVFTNYLAVDSGLGGGNANVCGNLGYYAYATHNHSSTDYGTDAVLELVPGGSTSLANIIWFRNNGDIELNGQENVVGTTATGPFPYGPKMSGVPTGTPNGHTGQEPFGVIDTADLVPFFYNGSGWSDSSGGVYTAVSSTATIAPTVKYVGVTASSTYAITLPSAASYQGREIIFFLVSGTTTKTATISAASGDGIYNNPSSITMGATTTGNYHSYVRLVSIGANSWYWAGGS